MKGKGDIFRYMMIDECKFDKQSQERDLNFDLEIDFLSEK